MAADSAAAKRYAQAAFELAVESGTIAEWRTDLDDIASVLTDSGLAALACRSHVPVEERQNAVQRILDVQPLALNLAKLLVQRFRSRDARAIVTRSPPGGRARRNRRCTGDHGGPIDGDQSLRIEQQISSRSASASA